VAAYTKEIKAMIAELRRTGLCRLGQVSWVKDFTDYLATCEKFAGHVKDRPRPGIWHNSMADVMAAPKFAPYARTFTPLASEYFGEPAHLWSFNAFYTDENTPYIPSVNGLHRDREAPKILVLFMLGTRTEAEAAQLIANGPEKWDAIYGPAGTAWLADTTYRHCGLLPKEPRMIAWARWANVPRG
jgi:hypothetical protein